MSGSTKNHKLSNKGKPSQRILSWRVAGICLGLAAITLIVFGQSLRFEFVNYDDNTVYDNPAITHGLSPNGIVWAFTHRLNDNWLPLTALSHMLDCQLWGTHPAGHHFTNVLLHIATVILLFLVLRNMTGALWRSAFVAAVFAIHPLRVESVAWVAERKDVLSGLFFVLTIAAYVRYARRPWSSVRYGCALLLFALGLMCKPMLVTLPAVLLLLDYWPLHRKESVGKLLMEKLPLLALSAGGCVATLLAQRDALRAAQPIGLPERIGNGLTAYAAYIGQMFYPAGLAVYYPHPEKHQSVWIIGLSMLILSVVSAGVLAGRRKHPYLPVGWLWYLGMLVPVIGLVQVGSQARADRYTYLPQIGLYLMVTWGAAEVCARFRLPRVALGTAAATILIGLVAGAYAQTAYWQNSVSLWSHALACTPANPIVRDHLAEALTGQGRLAEAMEYCQQALQLKPDDPEAHNNLGVALSGQGKLAEAVPYYEQALQLEPDYAEAHNNLGLALADQGNLTEAIPHFERAIQLKPEYTEAHVNLGNAYASQGKLAEAILEYQQAIQLKPDYAEVHNDLGVMLMRQEKLEEAIPHYEKALQLEPQFAEAHNNLGAALAQQGKLAEARQQYERALNLATAQNNTSMADSIRNRLKSFPSNLPPDQKR